MPPDDRTEEALTAVLEAVRRAARALSVRPSYVECMSLKGDLERAYRRADELCPSRRLWVTRP